MKKRHQFHVPSQIKERRMREIKFGEGTDESQVWADMYRAFNAGEPFLTGSKKVIDSCVKVYVALEAASVKEGEDGQMRLNPEGATLLLEDAHYDVLRDAVDAVLERGLHVNVSRGLPAVRPLDARRAAKVLDRVREAGTAVVPPRVAVQKEQPIDLPALAATGRKLKSVKAVRSADHPADALG